MAKDKIHGTVIIALEKDGWIVNKNPLFISYDVDERAFEIDLGAEKLLTASKGRQRIAVEVKTFAGSVSNQFHLALGQFLDYEAALAASPDENDRILYIALPEEAYAKLNSIKFFRNRIRQHRLRFITLNLIEQTIAEWIS